MIKNPTKLTIKHKVIHLKIHFNCINAHIPNRGYSREMKKTMNIDPVLFLLLLEHFNILLIVSCKRANQHTQQFLVLSKKIFFTK